MNGLIIINDSKLLVDVSNSLNKLDYNCHYVDYDLDKCLNLLPQSDFIIVEFVDDFKFIKDLATLGNISIIVCLKSLDIEIRKTLVELGVDYIFIPFHMDELFIRLKKIMPKNNNSFLDGYTIDFSCRLIFDKEQVINLSGKEFDLLSLFFSNQGVAFNREEILNLIWGDNYFGSERVVDDTLRRLRKKMPKLQLHTLYGYGYRLH